ncbi:MAG: DsrE family protein [Pseudomonadota bacterium]
MTKYLFILNDPPYGTERSYNALRLARSMLKKAEGGIEIRIFLMGDASACAKAGQKVPQGFYNIGDMLGMVISAGGEVGVCGNCMDTRGIKEPELIPDAYRGTLDEITEWTLWADRVLVF